MPWDEVKARSATEQGAYCWDCWVTHDIIGTPCKRHCLTDEERAERDRRFNARLAEARRPHPILSMLTKAARP